MIEELTATAADLQGLYGILNGPVRAKLLLAGIELGVFQCLAAPASVQEVAATLHSHPENTRLFLDGLTAVGLLKKRRGRYQNTDIAQKVLIREAPVYLGQLLTMMAPDLPLETLLSLVRQGPPEKKSDMGSEGIWASYAVNMANYQRAGLARQAVDIVSQLPGFYTFQKMLDLGGGPGIVCLAVTAASPAMAGVIFDRPAVTKVAETFIQTYQMEDRVSTMAGDYMHDPIGEGYDLVWTSATLNFAGNDLDIPVKKIFRALKPGGAFVSLTDGLTGERTVPEEFVLSNLSNALMGHDFGIDQGKIAQTMERVGFSRISSRTVDTPMMPMDLDIAWKQR